MAFSICLCCDEGFHGKHAGYALGLQIFIDFMCGVSGQSMNNKRCDFFRMDIISEELHLVLHEEVVRHWVALFVLKESLIITLEFLDFLTRKFLRNPKMNPLK